MSLSQNRLWVPSFGDTPQDCEFGLTFFKWLLPKVDRSRASTSNSRASPGGIKGDTRLAPPDVPPNMLQLPFSTETSRVEHCCKVRTILFRRNTVQPELNSLGAKAAQSPTVKCPKFLLNYVTCRMRIQWGGFGMVSFRKNNARKSVFQLISYFLSSECKQILK